MNEKSPYLQQHAHNPVEWYPWGKAPFDKAQDENKPILLSIGYAACHWCHVMAHESFEDPTTAELMNKLFINIKVDKEERPDLDKIYQMSHYCLTQQHGGWPLTVFLTPDLTPFFSGTYFPREERHPLPAFGTVLQLISDLYKNRPHDVKNQGMALKKFLQQQPLQPSSLSFENNPLELATDALKRSYDPVYGGFGHAPKFPQASKIEYLLKQSSPLALATLRHIATGGIYDQLEGGFYRYSVDEKWTIPHFEKMLYDNGQLLSLYAQASKHYAEPYFYAIAHETAEWAMKRMQSPNGGFYSSIDADSEEEEGKFYRWDNTDIQSLLTHDEYAVVHLYFGLDKPPNFEEHWHLYVATSLESIGAALTLSIPQVNQLLISAKKKMLSSRNQRIKPGRDEKILTSWNGLMIKGMLLAGYVLKEKRFIASAEQAIHFIQKNMWHHNQLLACYKDDQGYLGAYLDDYAFLLDALLTSLQVNWNSDHLLFAISIADLILKHFSDDATGGFYFTANHHEKLLYRPKTMVDEATPAGNGIIVRAFLTLGHLLGEVSYLKAAEKTLQAAWSDMVRLPAEHCTLLLGLKDYLDPPQLIIIRGKKDELNHWQDVSQSMTHYTFAIPDDALNLPSALATKTSQRKTCAYICQGPHCEARIDDIEKLAEKIMRTT